MGKPLHPFYKRLILFAVYTVAAYALYIFVKSQVGGSAVADAVMGLAISKTGMILAILSAVLYVIYLLDESLKRAKKEKTSFVGALVATENELREDERAAHTKPIDFPDELKPLAKIMGAPINNGLFWLLFVIIVGLGSIFFFVWRSQGLI